jgi:hypothetical protein
MSGLIQKVEGTITPESDAEVATPDVVSTEGRGTDAETWFWAEGVPGEGEKPEWLKAKYGNIVSKQAEAYPALERMQGQTKAPDEYEWGDFSNEFDLENEHIVELTNKAREMKLSQEGFNTLVGQFSKYRDSLMPNVDAEIAKLGQHAQAKIDTVNTWASNHLSDETLETLGKYSETADFINAIDEIRQLHNQTQSQIPTGVEIQSKVHVESVEDIDEEMIANYPKYKQSAAYRNELHLRRQRALGED